MTSREDVYCTKLDPEMKEELMLYRLPDTLRRVQTTVRNTLPSIDTIETEKIILEFEALRRHSPEGVNYRDFYANLSLKMKKLQRSSTDAK